MALNETQLEQMIGQMTAEETKFAAKRLMGELVDTDVVEVVTELADTDAVIREEILAQLDLE